MTAASPKNIVASVRARLLNLAKAHGEDYNRTLQRYANERYLYRLGSSPYRDRFVLKGGMLLPALGQSIYRPTRDIDLLGSGDTGEAALRVIFTEITATPVEPDGLTFDVAGINLGPIGALEAYGGVQILIPALLGSAAVPVRIDIGIGDAVTPAPVEAAYPTLLDMPSPILRMYPVETVIAEKFEAMVRFGLANTRIKDYYDIWTLARTQSLCGQVLADAFRNTFDRRGTALPVAAPTGLTDTFLRDRARAAQWLRFTAQYAPTGEVPELHAAGGLLQRFLMPPATAAATQTTFTLAWSPEIGWR